MKGISLRLLVLALAGSLYPAPRAAAVQVLDACWQPDVPFPQYAAFWSESSPAETALGLPTGIGHPLGGTLHLYLKNDTPRPLAIEDLRLEGISLRRAIAFSQQRKFKRVAYAASLYFSDLPRPERDRLLAAGEPVWWKVDPLEVPPGQACEAVVRLRRRPASPAVRCEVVALGSTVAAAAIPLAPARSRLAGICFGPGLAKVQLYFQAPRRGEALARILLDGADVTASATIGRDPEAALIPVVLSLAAPLARAALHCFQGVYADGSKATAAIRAWDEEAVWGIWGGKPGKEEDVGIGRRYVAELGRHNVSVQMDIVGSDACRAFMLSAEGKERMRALGIRRIVSDPGKADVRAAYYLADEPDTADFRVEGVPPQAKIGCLGQGLLARAAELRRADPETPQVLNVDMTFKPENWYTYAQLPDVFAADPYYQTRLSEAYWDKPGRLPLYVKATFVHAVAAVCRSACAPKPLHLILNSVRRQREGQVFRFGTPEEKRIEVYYALAAGARDFSFWWYTPIAPNATGAHGCGGPEPEAKALWREIGLLGAEVRTLSPVLGRSWPVEVAAAAPATLWVRALAGGTDTLVLLCVNDDYANDRFGTTIRPVENATVRLRLPAWLDATHAFELSAAGTGDVQWKRDGRDAAISLGTVPVTRMVLLTADAGLRARLRARYGKRFSANVRQLLAER